MLFWTVVLFISYSLVYFIVSQKKMKRLRNNNVSLSQENNSLLHQVKMRKGSYERILVK